MRVHSVVIPRSAATRDLHLELARNLSNDCLVYVDC